MSLPSHQLDAFLAVAQTLNFTKAAENLHVTQSALSQRVMNLEKELETTLLVRDRAGLRLTEAGHALVRYCRCKDSLEEEFLAGLKGQEFSGVVRIGGPSSVMGSVIVPALAPLFEAHANVKLHLIEDELDLLPARLSRGEIDFMVLCRREEREGLQEIELGHEDYVLVQNKKYRGPDVYLDHDENDQLTLNYLKRAGQRSKSIERRYLDNIHGLIAGVEHGLGRAVLPKHLIRGRPNLQIISPKSVLAVPVYLYFYAQPYYSKLHAKVVDLITGQAKIYLG